MSDIDESEIPEADDERLDEWVAEWLEDKVVKHLTDIDDESEVCGAMREQFLCECWPRYCNDDAAAMRLLKRLPSRIERDGQRPDLIGPILDTVNSDVTYWSGMQMHCFGEHADSLNRALAEAAATLAVRGVDPRGGDQ